MLSRQLLATLVAICISVGAQAAPMLTISGQGLPAAQAAEAAYVSSLSGSVTETFEGFAAGASSQSTSISTAVGTFSLGSAGLGGACDSGPYACANGPAVLDGGNTPFAGRYAAPPSNNWLDSMDAQTMTLSLLAGVTSIGFYLTDANDAGGLLGISGLNFDFSNLLGGSAGNGSIFYITIFDAAGLGHLMFSANDATDGYGLDNITISQVVTVPEPGTLTLMGVGLGGLVMLRRRRPARR